MAAYPGLYTKAVLTAFLAAGSALVTAMGDGQQWPSLPEWLIVAAAFILGFAAVFFTPNVPERVRTYGKAIAAALATLLSSLGQALFDGSLIPGEVVTIVVGTIIASGLAGLAPNAARSDPVDSKGRVMPLLAKPDGIVGPLPKG